jgi:nanoRNase/pAp phosphatase (c-di-AMP/oligoRNAs hydrolase)
MVGEEGNMKTEIPTIAEKNRLVGNIIAEIQEKDFFLLVGHKDPDTDCIAALAAFALILAKLQKEVTIYFATHLSEQFNYLLAICKYNNISVAYGKVKNLRNISTLVILDAAKPEMIAMNEPIAGLFGDPGIRKIEIDHHLSMDTRYSGDPGYCLVSDSSSTCELIGYLCLKFALRQGKPQEDFFSRNIASALLTGLVGESQMGKYLKNKKERWYYRLLHGIFSRLLFGDAPQDKVESMDGIFDVIQRFSVQEKRCFEGIMALKRQSPSVYYVCLSREQSEELFRKYPTELIVNVSKAAADTLAEESGRLGMVVYYDDEALTNFVQFRLRRSAQFKALDLRDLLSGLNIRNGGGHPGAVGFRVKKDDIADLGAYTEALIARLESLSAANS